jgi:hypothetical protein
MLNLAETGTILEDATNYLAADPPLIRGDSQSAIILP